MEESAEKKNGFFSNWIVKNILLAVLAVILLAVAADFVLANAEEGDLVITMGCGDVYKCAKLMSAKLNER